MGPQNACRENLDTFFILVDTAGNSKPCSVSSFSSCQGADVPLHKLKWYLRDLVYMSTSSQDSPLKLYSRLEQLNTFLVKPTSLPQNRKEL